MAERDEDGFHKVVLCQRSLQSLRPITNDQPVEDPGRVYKPNKHLTMSCLEIFTVATEIHINCVLLFYYLKKSSKMARGNISTKNFICTDNLKPQSLFKYVKQNCEI